MAAAITLEIVTPEGMQLSEQVQELTAPSVEGEFGVLPGHRPLLAALQPGLVRYRAAGGDHVVAVGEGFVELHEDRAVLLTERFLRKDGVDPVLARLELKEADEALERFTGEPGSSEWQALISRENWAAVQLELYGDPPPPRLRGSGFSVVKEDAVTEGPPVDVGGS